MKHKNLFARSFSSVLAEHTVSVFRASTNPQRANASVRDVRSRSEKNGHSVRSAAFTLVELLVVIAIIALLASVVIASLNSVRDKGRLASARYFATQVDHIAGEQAVGLWDFDDCPTVSTADASGFKNNGALSSGAIFSANTPTGQGCSVSFDGTDDYIDVGGGASLASAVLTWSAWVKTANDVTCNNVFSKGSVSSNESFDFGVGNCTAALTNELVSIVDVNNGNRVGYVTAARNEIYDGRWHNVVLVADGTVYKMYIDGKDEPLTTGMGANNGTTPVTNLTNSVIGAIQRTTRIAFFTGSIDAVHVFAKALTASEVGEIYASELPAHRLANNVK